MPYLLILRHAKSSWKFPELTDHDRPLNKRGRRDAPRIGTLMRQEGLIPDRVLCSTACRAKETWARVANALQAGPQETRSIDFLDEIYHASAGELLDVIRSTTGNAERTLLIGHNPGLEYLVTALTGEHVIMPTAALVQIELTADLEAVNPGRLVRAWKPKELDGDLV